MEKLSILVFLCFVLFLIVCVWNIYLTMQLSKYKEIERSLVSIKQETEDVLYSFIEEWKEENDQFLNKLSQNSNTNKAALKSNMPEKLKPEKKIEEIANNVVNRFDFIEQEAEIDYGDLLNQNLPTEKIENTQNPNFLDDKPIPFVDRKPSSSLVDQILSLKKNGLSIDEIAKKLDKGKTEIDLMLKLRQ